MVSLKEVETRLEHEDIKAAGTLSSSCPQLAVVEGIISSVMVKVNGNGGFGWPMMLSTWGYGTPVSCCDRSRPRSHDDDVDQVSEMNVLLESV